MKHMRKVHKNPYRSYRKRCAVSSDEVSFRIVVEETDLFVTAAGDFSEILLKAIREWRGEIQAWCAIYPEFRTSLVPLQVPENAPAIVCRMAYGAKLAGVGPFAAVAGTIAEMAANFLQPFSPDVSVENGGDVYIHSTRERVIGILPEPESGQMIGVRVAPEDFPLSFCASSARIGHSLSLGNGDIAVVRARDGAFADAAATALCNMLHEDSDVERAVSRAQQLVALGGLEGVFVQCNDKMAFWGRMELAMAE